MLFHWLNLPSYLHLSNHSTVWSDKMEQTAATHLSSCQTTGISTTKTKAWHNTATSRLNCSKQFPIALVAALHPTLLSASSLAS